MRPELSADRPIMQENLHYGQRVEPRSDVVHHDPRSLRQALELPNRRRLDRVKPSKKYKAHEKRFPGDRNCQQSDQLPRDFVNHHATRIFPPKLARDPCRRWNSNRHRDGRQN